MEWQTWQTQNLLPQGVGVQVPPALPRRGSLNWQGTGLENQRGDIPVRVRISPSPPFFFQEKIPVTFRRVLRQIWISLIEIEPVHGVRPLYILLILLALIIYVLTK